MITTQQASRKATIVGTAEDQWKAQGMMFDKLRDEGCALATEEVYGKQLKCLLIAIRSVA